MTNALLDQILHADPNAERPCVRIREIELRYHASRLVDGVPSGPLTTPKVVADTFSCLMESPREIFLVIHVDSQNRAIAYDVASIGSGDTAIVIPADVLRPLLYSGASGAIFCHQHPSGDPQPSPEDVRLTRRLREVLTLCGLRYLDHIILGESGRYFSFQEEGL